MRHSAAIWIVSAVVSLGAHAGVMSALARISIQAPKDETLAEVVLAGDAFGAVTAVVDTSQVLSSDARQDVASASAASPALAQSDASGMARETDAAAAGAAAAPSASATKDNVAAATKDNTAAASSTLPAAPADASAATAADNQGDVAAVGPSLPASTADATAAADGSIALVMPPSAASDVVPPGSNGGTAAGASPGNDQSAVPAADAAVAGNSSGTAAAASRDAPAAETAPSEAAAAPAANTAVASPDASPLVLPQGTRVASIATAAVSQAEKIDRFLSSYKGGGCLYAMPDVADAAKPAFAGFGAQQGVTDFAAAFKQAVGVEPAIAIRPIMEAQCAAVDFLRELGDAKIPRVKLVLDAEVIADGGAVTGHLADDPKGEVRLLVIGDDGAVNDISKEFFRTKGTNFFYSQVVTNAEGRSRNQIIVALVSSAPLTLTVTHQPGEAKALFEDLARQVKQPGTSVALGFSAFQVK